MKRSQPRRSWAVARAKVDDEGKCRLWYARDCGGSLEAAHIIGRSSDRPVNGRSTWIVAPERVVPLCSRHHAAYDRHDVDLLPVLTLQEQAQAVLDAGGLEAARRRVCPSAYTGIKAHG